MALRIVHYNNPVLRTKGEKVTAFDSALAQFANDMIDTMHEYTGVGLAAPQVHESVRLFVATIDQADDEQGEADPVVVINPEITLVGSEIIEDWEGCLSVPDIRGRVPRSREIVLRAFDRRGERIELRVHSYPARVIQHETDHLDGILFFDRMRSFDSLTFLDEYSRYWAKAD